MGAEVKEKTYPHRQQYGDGHRESGEAGRVKGDKCGQKEARGGVVSTQCSTQMMCYRIVHLQPIHSINQCHPNKFNKNV